MNNKAKLYTSIIRSNSAYKAYLVDKKYIQALRIFSANKEVYRLLEACIYEPNNVAVDLYINYIFHLEDWFHQFRALEEELKPKLDTGFVFERMEWSLPYPSNFIENLKEKL
ncbi:MAG: hypothetical protein R2776_09545 [Flavobacteriaceae bacterium]|nr:hypothetical protein [Flavobacteriaceae bacterium]